VERSVKEIRESGAEREIVRSSRQVLKQLGEELQKITMEELLVPKHNEPIEKGDIVRIRDGQERAEVIEIQGKHAIILCGTTRLRIVLTDLHKEHKKRVQNVGSASTIISPEATNEIDLRGLFR